MDETDNKTDKTDNKTDKTDNKTDKTDIGLPLCETCRPNSRDIIELAYKYLHIKAIESSIEKLRKVQNIAIRHRGRLYENKES